MQKLISVIKRSLLFSSIIILSGVGMPAAVLADSTTCAIPQPTGPGVHQPVGADASTYTYNCDTGLWQNSYFTYNPNTGIVTPTYPIIYTYNPASGLYDVQNWIYNTGSGKFVQVTSSVATPPAGATVVGAPVSTTNPTPNSTINNTGAGSNNTIDNNGGVGAGSIDNTGANSNNSLSGTGNNNTNLNNQNNVDVNNLLNQQANSGNSIVLGNTNAGSATSGNAQGITNVVNMLQSSSSALGGNAVTFVANINGDVNGNFLVDPATLGTVQPATVSPTGNNNLTVNNSTNAAINNNINVTANSGNATVADNTKAGNATTGTAQAIADVVNLINSAINSGRSFVGVININGNLNGNIEVPANLVNQLIADNVPTVTINNAISNTGAGSNNAISNNTGSNNTNVTNTNNQSINNVVNASAASGNATVSQNTSAGNATTGNASTGITAFNLTGSNVIGANDLLVFVNVLGTWVGMIINAPAGATAAELGGGITQNGVSNNNTTVNNTNNSQINNTINANAKSGNATVSQNTLAGNATSGNADTAVNLLNVQNSSLSLSGWFGILFINVFGSWHGNFGIYNPLALDSGGNQSSTSTQATTVASHGPALAFSFVPHSSVKGSNNSQVHNTISNTGSNSTNSVLASQVSRHSATPAPTLATHSSSLLLPAFIGSVFVIYVVSEYLSRRHERLQNTQ